MKRIPTVLVLLLASAQACAEFYSTDYLKRLIESCNSLPATFDATQENISRIKDCGLSTGYILGVYDVLDVTRDRSKCTPGVLKTEQIYALVDHWIRDHPEHWHQSADTSVHSAFDDAWSCAQ